MITFHWDDDTLMEIWSGIKLEARGRLIIKVHRGRVSLNNYLIRLYDPLNVVIIEKKIPEIDKEETWQVEFKLTNYLMYGKYTLIISKKTDAYLKFHFILQSRREPSQIFLLEQKLVAKNLEGKVESLNFKIKTPPNNFLIQNTGDKGVRRAELLNDNHINAENLKGKSQKTVTWWNIIQPSFLPLDTHYCENLIDEYYVFNQPEYQDEPGLEITHPELENYDGTYEIKQPIKTIRDVMEYVHRNMRYVRQSKERGLNYALKHKRGDCTEYSAFFVSLLRKLGLKARIVSGMGRSIYNNWIAHAFAEVFIFGVWVPIDVVKPPKPYLQIGNRGDLIALNRINWLNPEFKEHEIQFMAQKGINPKITISQKLTESGIKTLPALVRQSEPKIKLIHYLKRKKSTISVKKLTETYFIINIPEMYHDIQSIGILEGNPAFGRIIFLQFIDRRQVRIEIPGNIDLKNLRMFILNDSGNLIFIDQLDNLI